MDNRKIKVYYYYDVLKEIGITNIHTLVKEDIGDTYHLFVIAYSGFIGNKKKNNLVKYLRSGNYTVADIGTGFKIITKRFVLMEKSEYFSYVGSSLD